MLRIAVYTGTSRTSVNRIGYIDYLHLAVVPSRLQTVGTKVNRWGEVLGRVATTQDGLVYNEVCWARPHVHFEMYSMIDWSC